MEAFVLLWFDFGLEAYLVPRWRREEAGCGCQTMFMKNKGARVSCLGGWSEVGIGSGGRLVS